MAWILHKFTPSISSPCQQMHACIQVHDACTCQTLDTLSRPNHSSQELPMVVNDRDCMQERLVMLTCIAAPARHRALRSLGGQRGRRAKAHMRGLLPILLCLRALSHCVLWISYGAVRLLLLQVSAKHHTSIKKMALLENTCQHMPQLRAV